jgi:hypothetical protein
VAVAVVAEVEEILAAVGALERRALARVLALVVLGVLELLLPLAVVALVVLALLIPLAVVVVEEG